MLGIMDKELDEERSCMIFLKDQPCPANLLIRGVITRSGRTTNPMGEFDHETTDSDSKIQELEGDDDYRTPHPLQNPGRETNMSHLILSKFHQVTQVM